MSGSTRDQYPGHSRDLAAVRQRHPGVAHLGDRELESLLWALECLAEQTVDAIIKDHRAQKRLEQERLREQKDGEG